MAPVFFDSKRTSRQNVKQGEVPPTPDSARALPVGPGGSDFTILLHWVINKRDKGSPTFGNYIPRWQDR